MRKKYTRAELGTGVRGKDAADYLAGVDKAPPGASSNCYEYNTIQRPSRSAQEHVGLAGPAWAVMYGGLMVTNGSRLPAQFGALPRFEADLIAVVRDADLVLATTPLEALRHISEILPFIELPDLMPEGTPSGIELIATNIEFRGSSRDSRAFRMGKAAVC